jgi:hypothetical protein
MERIIATSLHFLLKETLEVFPEDGNQVISRLKRHNKAIQNPQ